MAGLSQLGVTFKECFPPVWCWSCEAKANAIVLCLFLRRYRRLATHFFHFLCFRRRLLLPGLAYVHLGRQDPWLSCSQCPHCISRLPEWGQPSFPDADSGKQWFPSSRAADPNPGLHGQPSPPAPSHDPLVWPAPQLCVASAGSPHCPVSVQVHHPAVALG